MFVHLHCHSPYSFLDGASSIDALVAQAAAQGMPALALTDRNTIAGQPEFHRLAAAYGVKPIAGAELTMEDGSQLVVLAEHAKGFRHLCELLTRMHVEARDRADPRLREADLFERSEGLLVLSGGLRGFVQRALARRAYGDARRFVERYRDVFGDRFYLEWTADGLPGCARRMRDLLQLAEATGVPDVAATDVRAASPEEVAVHDVLTCIRVGCHLQTPHPERPFNRLGYLHDEAEARRRFAQDPRAMARTVEIAERCSPVFPAEGPLFPEYRDASGRGGVELLDQLVWQGARERYGKVSPELQMRLEHELAIIRDLGYADYFLVVWDIVRYARSRGIRCAGRGSAADSVVAYCLYLTDVDALNRNLLFERFLSRERAERPDIDIDFASDRRDEVIDYVYRRYGRDRVARVATYQTFRARSAVREVGRVFGIPEELLDTLAKRIPWSTHADEIEEALERVPELRDFQPYRRAFQWMLAISRQIAGFPRHFGTHTGGIVVSGEPLMKVTSLQPSASGWLITPYDKRLLEDVGLVKLDLLSLRTMAAVEGALRLGTARAVDYDRIPMDDEATFASIRRGDTIGVFQLESPAQRALQVRLGAESLEDLVASVALIRPGPIQGNMVDPFLARRRGLEPVSYLHPKLEPILGKTYGVVLFQEQVIEIATAIAGFTPGEADELRRVMSHARNRAEMEQIGERFVQKAVRQGVPLETAKTLFSYIRGYASYGFCEAHAAAFATTAYKTAYLIEHHPASFFAAVLNQLPMGYYPAHVICAEARRRGVRILPVDIQESDWDAGVPEPDAIRLGFRLIRSFSESVARALVEERQASGPFRSLADAVMRLPQADALHVERLIRAGAFDRVETRDRRELLWQLPRWLALRKERDLALFDTIAAPGQAEGAARLSQSMPPMSLAERIADEYSVLGVGVSGHWLSLYREALRDEGYCTLAEAGEKPEGAKVTVAGLSIRPHRPPTKSGKTVVFFTLEDETGLADAVMFETVYRREGAVLFTPFGRLIGLSGLIERRGGLKAQIRVEHIWTLASG
ncbi:MAG: DNA polymerase III subunit alpha [Alicyclobacillus mali]|uniref:DNA polymerase III subunit alpha n=1 Tax=Alicyclobacillus mali (ex Roth et al. 2021) TaxID=1123961 RepID=UPI0023F001C7|nr:DNA polymerase III subunit alpha [Alicyclobacillus mali (ex Roth et al. 2021)]MCL6487917.1 DNA polymerase III subunit alpha [Alicyclobacillus mali (ex Roth et al. 2021)]